MSLKRKSELYNYPRHEDWDQPLALHKSEGIGGRVVRSCDAYIPVIQVTEAEEPQIQGSHQPSRTPSELNNDKGNR